MSNQAPTSEQIPTPVSPERKDELAEMARDFIKTQPLAASCNKAHRYNIGVCPVCERDAFRRDAERYRYLCTLNSLEWAEFGRVPDNEIDAAIDKAIAQAEYGHQWRTEGAQSERK